MANCSLIINGAVNQTNATITEGVTQQFTLTGMATGIYTWNVNCTDDSAGANEGSGVARTLNVTILPPIEVEIETKNCTSPGFGPQEDVFNPGGPDVCAYGNISGITGCGIWVCPDRDNWTEGDNLTSVGCYDLSAGPLSGEFNDVNVMDANLTNAGYYDLVLDCNQSEIYETATDALDDADIMGSSPGFHVTPEAAALLMFAAGLAALYGFARVRRKK